MQTPSLFCLNSTDYDFDIL